MIDNTIKNGHGRSNFFSCGGLGCYTNIQDCERLSMVTAVESLLVIVCIERRISSWSWSLSYCIMALAFTTKRVLKVDDYYFITIFH